MKTFLNKKYEVIKENAHFPVQSVFEIIDHRLKRTFISYFEVLTEQDKIDVDHDNAPDEQTYYEYEFIIKLTQYDSSLKKMHTSYFNKIDGVLVYLISDCCKEIK